MEAEHLNLKVNNENISYIYILYMYILYTYTVHILSKLFKNLYKYTDLE